MSANRSTGSDIKSEKFASRVAEALAAAIMGNGGGRALHAAGVAAAHALASESSGKAVAKNARRVIEEQAAHQQKCAAWEVTAAARDKYSFQEGMFLATGFYLPFVIPPPHPGPHPGSFISSADKHRQEHETRAAANKAKMAALIAAKPELATASNSSSCAGAAAGGAIAARAEARAREERQKKADVLYARRMLRLRALGPKMLAWARSLRSANAPRGHLDVLNRVAIKMAEAAPSANQHRKWANVIRFCSMLHRKVRIIDLSIIGYTGDVVSAGAGISTCVHFSNLPGAFSQREMKTVVLPQLRTLVSQAARHLLRGKSGHTIVNNNVVMRGMEGCNDWSSGFAFIEVETAELAAAIVAELQLLEPEIYANCYNLVKDKKTGKVTPQPFGKRYSTLKIQVSASVAAKKKREQCANEELARRSYQLAFRDKVAEEKQRKAEAKAAAEALERQKQEFVDSFVALPGAKPVVKTVHVGPSLRDQLLGAKRVETAVVAPVNAPVGWHNGEILHVVNVADMLARFNGFIEPVSECPIRVVTVENGWENEEWISVEEAERRVAEEDAAATATAAAAAKAAKAAAAAVTVVGKKNIYAAFFPAPKPKVAVAVAVAEYRDQSWSNSSASA